MKKKVIAAGHICLDITPVFPEMKAESLDQVLSPGKLLQKVKRAGTAVSLDMAAVDPGSEPGRADWKTILERTLPFVDFFVPSAEELCYMLDRERFYQWQERARGGDVTQILDPEEDIRPLAEMCMDMGCQILLIKCGAPGMYFKTADSRHLEPLCSNLEMDPALWGGREIFERISRKEFFPVPGPEIPVSPLFSRRFSKAADRKSACISPRRPARPASRNTTL